MEQGVKPTGIKAYLKIPGDHALDVIRPRRMAGAETWPQIELGDTLEIRGYNPGSSIITSRGDDDGLPLDSQWQNITTVIVGVLTNQVDPARRGGGVSSWASEGSFETVTQVSELCRAEGQVIRTFIKGFVIHIYRPAYYFAEITRE